MVFITIAGEVAQLRQSELCSPTRYSRLRRPLARRGGGVSNTCGQALRMGLQAIARGGLCGAWPALGIHGVEWLQRPITMRTICSGGVVRTGVH